LQPPGNDKEAVMSKKQPAKGQPLKKQPARKPPKQRVCIIHGCNHPRSARGLCQRCYVAAGRIIETGKESWSSLEKKGLALPVGKIGRPRTAPIAVQLDKINQQQSAK
jgi:hypothetical protein